MQMSNEELYAAMDESLALLRGYEETMAKYEAGLIQSSRPTASQVLSRYASAGFRNIDPQLQRSPFRKMTRLNYGRGPFGKVVSASPVIHRAQRTRQIVKRSASQRRYLDYAREKRNRKSPNYRKREERELALALKELAQYKGDGNGAITSETSAEAYGDLPSLPRDKRFIEEVAATSTLDNEALPTKRVKSFGEMASQHVPWVEETDDIDAE